MEALEKYEVVIGLEVHAQLQTNTKLFCGDSVAYGAPPNTQVSPITLGLPGTLPSINKKAVEYAVRMGIACHSTIETINYFARKHYFYPDLPKGYQTSQHTTPICIGGYVNIPSSEGDKPIILNRIHLEEDAGKSIHDQDDNYTLIDLNRAGTPLIEIVTEPCIRSSEDAFLYVSELRRLVKWINICDGNMEEGSLRCDANVSIRLKGEDKLGTKVEVKNLNSIRNIKKAIDYEVGRMAKILDDGGVIVQQTRGYNADKNETYSIRDKEEANDYRYFADPDLPPFRLSAAYIQSIQESMPELPWIKSKELITNFGLSLYDATQLCEEKTTIDYFDKVAKHTTQYKAIANWMLGPLREYIKEHDITFEQFNLQPNILAALIEMVEEGKVNFSIAASRLLPILVTENTSPLSLAESLNLLQVKDSSEIEQWIEEVLISMPDKVIEYQKGKKGLIGLFVGAVKKLSKGKADPKIVTDLITKKLEKI